MKSMRFALLGHPVAQSVSASMFAAAFRAAKMTHTYTPIDVQDPADLGRLLHEIRGGYLDGANVTLPHKHAVLQLVDELDPTAGEVSAANVIARTAAGRIVGHNTDTRALEEEIAAATTLRSRAAILGAGGAARAAIAACTRLGFQVIGVTTRSWTNTEATYDAEAANLARQLGALACSWPETGTLPSGKLTTAMRLQWTELAVQADLIIQATSAGVTKAEEAARLVGLVPWAALPKHAVALDLLYRPRVTPFVAAAKAAGLKGITGLGMLVRQAEAAFRIWTGVAPPEGVMRLAAETALSPR